MLHVLRRSADPTPTAIMANAPAGDAKVAILHSDGDAKAEPAAMALATPTLLPLQLLGLVSKSLRTTMALGGASKQDECAALESPRKEQEPHDNSEAAEVDQVVSPRLKKLRLNASLETEEKKEEKETSMSDAKGEAEGEATINLVLPPELMMRVFYYLPVRDLARAAQACSWWHSLAEADLLWRSLYNHARNHHHLEYSPRERSSSTETSAETTMTTTTTTMSWKARYRETYSCARRKFWFGSNVEAFVHLDQTNFQCCLDDDPEEFVTGEVVLNVYVESMTTHGLYLTLVGEEAFKAIDSESLSMNATEEKANLFEIYVPLSGNTEWAERKKNKHMFFRGTYHYPFRVPFPRKTIAGRSVPPSFNRRVKTSSGFFRVTYHAQALVVVSFPHVNVTSRRHTLRLRPSERWDNRMRTRVMNKYSAPVTERITHNSFNYLYFQKSGDVVLEVALQKQYFFINAEEMKLVVSVDNSQGRFPVHAITVTLVEVLQERDNDYCREVVEHRGSRRVYTGEHVQIGRGEVRRDIELHYPVTDANAKGGSLFSTGLFQQRFSVSVSLNIFGCVDPRVEIPLFVLRVPS